LNAHGSSFLDIVCQRSGWHSVGRQHEVLIREAFPGKKAGGILDGASYDRGKVVESAASRVRCHDGLVEVEQWAADRWLLLEGVDGRSVNVPLDQRCVQSRFVD
jgi:hypothetical protein